MIYDPFFYNLAEYGVILVTLLLVAIIVLLIRPANRHIKNARELKKERRRVKAKAVN